MKKTKTQTGITLIALIITIVILLILAVVTIRSVTGDGIIGKAQQAKGAYQTAQEDEKTALGNYLTTMEDITKVSNISSYTEEGVPIPKGFYYVGGTKKDEGVVISSVEGDDMNNTKKGNQFVWVPVETDIDPEGYGLGSTYRREPDVVTQELQGWDETTGTEIYIDGADKDVNNLKIINDILGKTYKTSDDFLVDLKTDYKAMVESVNANNGFYVGRYETSLSEDKKAVQSVKGVDTGTVYEDSANWYELYAYQKAYSTSSVQGSMIWGVQYNAMMTWMQNTGTDVCSQIEGKNTTTLTGTVETDKINNVYDLYGNSWEWTAEAVDPFNRSYYGGNSYNEWMAPCSMCGAGPEAAGIGASRLALYIK